MYIIKRHYNSKFQEIETVQTLKIQKKTTKFVPNKFLKINDYARNQQKTRKEKIIVEPNEIIIFYFNKFSWYKFLGILNYTEKNG